MLAVFLAWRISIRLRYISTAGLCRIMSSLSNDSEYVYVAFPDRPLYLKRVQPREIEIESRREKTACETSTFHKNSVRYLLFAGTEACSVTQDHYINSAIRCQSIYRKSAEWMGVNAAHAVWKSNLPHSADTALFTRGVCLYADKNCDASTIIAGKIADQTQQEQGFVAYELKHHGKSNLMTLSCLKGSSQIDRDSVFSVAYQLVEGQTLSPIFNLSEISPVFHSYAEARTVLEKLYDTPEVKELLDITDKLVSIEFLKNSTDRLPHPFVVVEGMDATGKTTLTKELEKRMGAARYFTPPAPITALRAHFDKYPEIVRRAYYCLGNYIVAMEIIKECQTRPVIMDRFWHSTTAYGIANETSSGDLPARDCPVYQWPQDLLCPTLVLFLTVSEEVRKHRHSGRGQQATFEERSLDRDRLFRQRLCESYRRMSKPSCIEIDAGDTVEDVKNKALDIMKQHGVKFGNT